MRTFTNPSKVDGYDFPTLGVAVEAGGTIDVPDDIGDDLAGVLVEQKAKKPAAG